MDDFIQTMTGNWVNMAAVTKATITSLDPGDFEDGEDTMGYILSGPDGLSFGEVRAADWFKAIGREAA